jgi:quercetin dioxygenase-like cupin family protein
MPEPVVSSPTEGERLERGNRTITIRIELPGLSVNEIEFDETFAVQPHTHGDHVDAFYVLEGEVEFTVGEETVVAGPGTLLAAPADARHGFRGVRGKARMLNFHAPDAGFAASLRGSKPSQD